MRRQLKSNCDSNEGLSVRFCWPRRFGRFALGLCAVTGCGDGGSEPRVQSGGPNAEAPASGDEAPGTDGDTLAGASSGGPELSNPGAAMPASSGAAGSGGGREDATTGGTDGASGGGGESGESGSSEEDAAIDNEQSFTQLRLLTQSEYRRSIESLFGANTDVDSLDLPADRVDRFATVGGLLTVVGVAHATDYQVASEAVVAALFNDAERWNAFVGCEPQADLSDACVETFVRTFGRRAFRRDLDDAEAARWVALARSAAALTDNSGASATTGLAAATAGMLQSPKFLYRVEHAWPDAELRRIRFDGASMATRLAYLTTGSTPDDALLDAASAGELNSEEGVGAAVERLMSLAQAKDFPAEFFEELTELDTVLELDRPAEDLSEVLRQSMIEETERWLREVVLAPQADVRSFFDGSTTFVDGPLAEFYGVPAPSDGFQEVELDPSTGRAGILGKAGFLLAHSSATSSNPARRGNFILTSLMCRAVAPRPDNLTVTIPQPTDTPMTTRQLFEGQHRDDPSCAACHVVIDPPGFALEHFDAIGRYRETENGLPIDSSGELDGEAFEDAIGLAEVLRNRAEVSACLVENFYRYANGASDAQADADLLAELTTELSSRGYVWRELIKAFAASEAFNSVSLLEEVPEATGLEPAESAESAQ